MDSDVVIVAIVTVIVFFHVLFFLIYTVNFYTCTFYIYNTHLKEVKWLDAKIKQFVSCCEVNSCLYHGATDWSSTSETH